MIRRIAHKEALEVFRDGRFRWSAGIVFILLFASLLVGWKQYAAFEADRERAQQSDREVWLGQGEKNQHSAAHFGNYAFKPVTPLSAVDRGLLPYTGVSIFLEGHNVKEASHPPAADRAALDRLGSLTASTTLQLLVPLLILLLVYAAFAGEREMGTLRQVMSLGVPLRRLVVGKALGVAIPLAVLLVPAAILGVVAMALYAGPDALVWSLPRMGAMVLLYVVYFGVMVFIGLAVSAWAPSSRVALVVLLGFWFMNGFIVHRVALDAVEAVHPSPSRTDFESAIQADMDALPPWSERRKAIETRLMEQYQVATPAEIPASISGLALLEGEADETAIYRAHFAGLRDNYEAQSRGYQWGALVAPLTGVMSLSMGIAGSDYAHHRHFLDQAEVYRFDYVQYLNQNMVDTKAGSDYRADASFWATVPPFAYEGPGLGWALAHHRIALFLLAAWGLGVLFITPLVLRRVRVD